MRFEPSSQRFTIALTRGPSSNQVDRSLKILVHAKVALRSLNDLLKYKVNNFTIKSSFGLVIQRTA
jgi:hypothetical protein